MDLPLRSKIDLYEIKLNRNRKYKQMGLKPNGFWYSMKDSWYNHLCEYYDTDKLYNSYVYEIKLKSLSSDRKIFTKCISHPDYNKILLLETIKDIDIFTNIYGRVMRMDKNKNKDKFISISCSQLVKDYGGIEVRNYEKLIKSSKFEDKHRWLKSYDCSSGCIWNLDIIKEVNLVEKLPELVND